MGGRRGGGLAWGPLLAARHAEAGRGRGGAAAGAERRAPASEELHANDHGRGDYGQPSQEVHRWGPLRCPGRSSWARTRLLRPAPPPPPRPCPPPPPPRPLGAHAPAFPGPGGHFSLKGVRGAKRWRGEPRAVLEADPAAAPSLRPAKMTRHT